MKTNQNRVWMRQMLTQRYQDFLADSLEQAMWLDLDLADKPDALYISLATREAHLSARLLPTGTSILQVYDEAQQELLILGEPGSGKSTQLYFLGQYLLARAKKDQMVPLPIIFPLSSWALHCSLLEMWMAEQLTQIYRVPKRLAQQWVQDQQIIPLLDGLDEMEETARPRCLQAINRYHLEHRHPLVVCSRSAEYAAASQLEQFALQRAVVVQPLTPTQIDTLLGKGGNHLAGLRAACKQNAALQELATVPLLLNLLILTYQDTPTHALPSTGEALQHQVFEQYVQRMVTRKGDTARYPLIYTTHWLAFLAQQMRLRNQTVFAIELLNPSWLVKVKHLRLGNRLGFGIIYGLIAELIPTLGAGLFAVLLGKPLISGLIVGLSFGLADGVNWALSPKPDAGIGKLLELDALDPSNILTERLQGSRSNAVAGLFMGLFTGLLFGLIIGLIFGMSFGLIFGSVIGLSFGLIFGLRGFLLYVVMRFWLWRAGLFPLRAISFLEDARARHLLKRVGGTYQFAHRLLLDYFADSESF